MTTMMVMSEEASSGSTLVIVSKHIGEEGSWGEELGAGGEDRQTKLAKLAANNLPSVSAHHRWELLHLLLLCCSCRWCSPLSPPPASSSCGFSLQLGWQASSVLRSQQGLRGEGWWSIHLLMKKMMSLICSTTVAAAAAAAVVLTQTIGWWCDGLLACFACLVGWADDRQTEAIDEGWLWEAKKKEAMKREGGGADSSSSSAARIVKHLCFSCIATILILFSSTSHNTWCGESFQISQSPSFSRTACASRVVVHVSTREEQKLAILSLHAFWSNFAHAPLQTLLISLSLSLSPTLHSDTISFCISIAVVAFDSLDPNANITIKWDVMTWASDGYIVRCLLPSSSSSSSSSCSNKTHKPQKPQTDLQLNISPFDLHARWIVCPETELVTDSKKKIIICMHSCIFLVWRWIRVRVCRQAWRCSTGNNIGTSSFLGGF